MLTFNYLIPNSRLDRYRVELSIGDLMNNTCSPSLALVTLLYILLDVVTHVPPKETAADLLESLVTTQMSAGTIAEKLSGLTHEECITSY